MRAELVVDLNDLGAAIGRAKGRSIAVYPVLQRLHDMWAVLGAEVTAMHLITTTGGVDRPRNADELFFDAWWKSESILTSDAPFRVTTRFCARGPNGDNTQTGPVGLDGLVVNTALSRSDLLARDPDSGDTSVIVMSSSPHVVHAVTYARGAPVLLASTRVPDSALAHVRLEAEPLGLLATRTLSGKQPSAEELALAGAIEPSTNGRNPGAALLPDNARSLVILDRRNFSLDEIDQDSSFGDQIVRTVQTLGLGTDPHLLDVDHEQSEAELFAQLYRFANEHRNLPIVLASTAPGLIAASADLANYHLPNPRRVLRLCPQDRRTNFDDSPYISSRAASRVVVEDQFLELLRDFERIWPSSDDERREATRQWRIQQQRRYVLLDARGAEATPADSTDGHFLPLTVNGCKDFELREPALRPGLVVEAVLNEEATEWMVVSDAIERRRRRRDENLTQEEIMAMRKGPSSTSELTSTLLSLKGRAQDAA